MAKFTGSGLYQFNWFLIGRRTERGIMALYTWL